MAPDWRDMPYFKLLIKYSSNQRNRLDEGRICLFIEHTIHLQITELNNRIRMIYGKQWYFRSSSIKGNRSPQNQFGLFTLPLTKHIHIYLK